MRTIDPVLIELPMPIVSKRLLIRPWRAGDGAQLLEAKRESWAELSRWLKWASGPAEALSEAAEEARVRRRSAKFILRSKLELPAFSRADGRLLAVGDYHAMDWEGRMFSTGYWVRTSAAGDGIATELTHALIRYAFGALAANRLAISHAEGNERSRRVIEKLGFEKEGSTRRFYVLNEALMDSHHYARFDGAGLPDWDVRWE